MGEKKRRYYGLDLGYRIGYRVKWFGAHIFGGPQTTPEFDLVRRLERQREERYARRAAAAAARRRGESPITRP
jgi:hypothetical protein